MPAEAARAIGDGELAGRSSRQAETAAARVPAAFWCEDLGTYALALDGHKRACRVRASNAGHASVERHRRARACAAHRETLMGPAFFSGWGIRTIAQGEPRYNPMSYHNGSIWPHDNALVGRGHGALRPTPPGGGGWCWPCSGRPPFATNPPA